MLLLTNFLLHPSRKISHEYNLPRVRDLVHGRNLKLHLYLDNQRSLFTVFFFRYNETFLSVKFAGWISQHAKFGFFRRFASLILHISVFSIATFYSSISIGHFLNLANNKIVNITFQIITISKRVLGAFVPLQFLKQFIRAYFSVIGGKYQK